MREALKTLLAGVAVASLAGSASAFGWGHHCCHIRVPVVPAVPVAPTTGGVGVAPVGVVGVAPVGVAPVGVGVGTVGVAPTTVGLVGFPAVGVGVAANTGTPVGLTVGLPLPANLTPLAPANPATPPAATTPAPASCATTADVQKLLDERFTATHAKIDAAKSEIKSAIVTEAKIREIVKDEVAKQIKEELQNTATKQDLQNAIREIKAALKGESTK